jgi:hypothetical protein
MEIEKAFEKTKCPPYKKNLKIFNKLEIEGNINPTENIMKNQQLTSYINVKD